MDVKNTKPLIINILIKSISSIGRSRPHSHLRQNHRALTNSVYYFYFLLNRILPLIYVVIVRAGNTGNKATEQPTSAHLL